MAKKTTKQVVISSTIFSLNKRILPSSATFYGAVWEDRHTNAKPIDNEEKTVRGVMSHHIKPAVSGDPLKLLKEIEKSNIQTIDNCSLAPEQDTLVTKFSVNFLPLKDGLEASNNPHYAKLIYDFLDEYSSNYSFKELALRYAYNIASGRHLWKNKIGAAKVEVTIKHLPFGSEDVKEWTFNSLNLGTLDKPSDDLQPFAETIAAAFKGEEPFALFNVTSAALRGNGQSVFPSQEFIQAKNDNKQAKGKVLYSTNGISGQHDQKIGNAIRTIDTWYDEFEEFQRPIPVEVYGAVTNRGKAYRPPASGTDYHSIAKRVTAGGDLTDTEKHYFVSMLIRGGVLGTEK